MKDRTYRFADVVMLGLDHEELADKEPVISAGYLKIRPGEVEIDGYSMSLHVGPDDEDHLRLKELFAER